MIAEMNAWATERAQPRPLVTYEPDDVSRYSMLIPGKLWLHRSYRLIGWGYRFPASIQFKAEYSTGNSEIDDEIKTFRIPLF